MVLFLSLLTYDLLVMWTSSITWIQSGFFWYKRRHNPVRKGMDLPLFLFSLFRRVSDWFWFHFDVAVVACLCLLWFVLQAQSLLM